MRIWIIIDGEKTGPFDIAQVARRIESGELSGEHHGWSEGMKEWQPLSSMPQFVDAFAIRKESTAPTVQPPSAESEISGPPVPMTAMLLRRFFARWFDMAIWSSLFMSVLVLSGADLKNLLMNFGFNYSMMLVWIILEASMMHLWRTTPGKSLLGIRVLSADGGNLSLGRSLLRSLRVYLMGMGMSHVILMPLCHAFSWWFVRKHGAALWDGPAVTRLEFRPLAPWRWLVYVIVLFLIVNAAGMILEPVSRELIKELFPNNPELLPK
jgi:uncharacterized RDD family membrane protein YckC